MTERHQADPAAGEARRRQVRTIFTEIAPRYDLLNHLLSLNVDKRWRRRAAAGLVEAVRRAPRNGKGRALLLDSCAGTCDLARELATMSDFDGFVAAADFALPMLVEGAKKMEGLPAARTCADALSLPFADDSLDGAAVAFGLRNLADTRRGLAELRRVLRPAGPLFVLEFTVPPNPVVRAGYHLYFKGVLPLLGRLVSGHPWAYSYLPRSVGAFPGPEPLADEFRRVGFQEVGYELLSFGIAALHWGKA